jgi:hypothetical protein
VGQAEQQGQNKQQYAKGVTVNTTGGTKSYSVEGQDEIEEADKILGEEDEPTDDDDGNLADDDATEEVTLPEHKDNTYVMLLGVHPLHGNLEEQLGLDKG